MLPQEVIARKRDGLELTEGDIGTFVKDIVSGQIGDAQAAAFAMAITIRGMNNRETVALTLAMRDSGSVLKWHHLPGPAIDKHSTGGVGDKVSLVLAPLVAACGGYVPMISGRGLGHTGGTLDKLESIPGYTTMPTMHRFREVVQEAGCAIVGASHGLAPADRRLYAIRDVTATVESIPLITASILSKKLAAGLAALVMDVKVGSGAFFPAIEKARELASSIVSGAKGAGLPCRALLTDMDQCLGRTAGNALELREALDMLRGEPTDPRLAVVTLSLAAELLVLGGITHDVGEARDHCERALASGAAAERFALMVTGLGGPADLLEHPDRHVSAAPVRIPVAAPHAGTITHVDARALGLAIIVLGGGRTRPGQHVDHAVGLSDVRSVGDALEQGEPLAIIHARDERTVEEASRRVHDAFTIEQSGAASIPQPVLEIV